MVRQEQIIRTHKTSSYYFLHKISLQLGFIYKIFHIFKTIIASAFKCKFNYLLIIHRSDLLPFGTAF